jgi:hypothetical protein
MALSHFSTMYSSVTRRYRKYQYLIKSITPLTIFKIRTDTPITQLVLKKEVSKQNCQSLVSSDFGR